MVGPYIGVWCDKQIGVYVRCERAVIRPIASSVWLVHGRCLQEGAVLGGRRLVANVNIDHWVVVVGWRLVGKYKWLIIPVHAIALVISFELLKHRIWTSISKAWGDVWTWGVWAAVS